MFALHHDDILAKVKTFYLRMQRMLTVDSVPLQLRYATTFQHLRFGQHLNLDYQPIAEGDEWGRSHNLQWQSAWFHLHAQQPAGWQQHPYGELALDIDVNGEALLFDAQGGIVQAVTDRSSMQPGYRRSTVFNAAPLFTADSLDLWLEASASHLFGLNREEQPVAGSPNYYGEQIGVVKKARLVLLDCELWHYLVELECGGGLAEALPSGSRRSQLLFALKESLNIFAGERDRLGQARERLRSTILSGVAPSALTTVAVGHAHIDTAWLWPISETRRKCGRTFSNQLRLMDHYPDYVFGASQPQLYQYTKEDYPQLYAKIKQRVAEGRWELQGAMWVEADTNIPSGESLVRQVLHGKNFYRDEFGADITNLWLPDVFGYSANLPQILQRSGVTSFLTQKISWNQYNDFPHHTFRWQGIDGSSVLTHFLPEDTYNSLLMTGAFGPGRGTARAQEKFKENHLLPEFLTLYGVGDGGGGPDELQVERGLLQAKGIEGAPQVRFGRADAFFSRLADFQDRLASWQGELYLELHRGTLTTQARVKQGNRRLEQQLRLVEWLYSHGGEYPAEQLDRLWKLLLVNQFHDIIPGSSIHEVYQRTHQEHQQGLHDCQALVDQWSAQLPHAENQLAVVNPYSLEVETLVSLPEGWQGAEGDGDSVHVLASEGGRALLRLKGQAVAQLAPAQAHLPSALACIGTDLVLENERIRYQFNSHGRLISAWDKEEQRECICQSPQNEQGGNLFTLYHDQPLKWDAWDIDLDYLDQNLQHLEADCVQHPSSHPLQREILFRYTISAHSQLEQRVRLTANSKKLEFDTHVNWAERHRMLRVSFPLDLNSQQAAFDIQYGYLYRPTHSNTSWDVARFEVVGQRYVDISEPNYGVALLNDCKYGHRVQGHVLDLNLLRSPTQPDPDADQGTHRFRYALFPHSGGLQQSMPQLQAEAALLNQGVATFPARSVAHLAAPLKVESEHVTLEVLKKAEKEKAWIARLVERTGQRSRVRLQAAAPLQECDLMEGQAIGEPLTPCCELTFTPFAIRTFKIPQL